MRTDDLMIDFRYVRRRTWMPARGRGTRTGVQRDVVEVGAAVLRQVDVADAPVALSLTTPESEYAMRMVDGTLMRPLRTESSWEPMDVAYLANGLGRGGRAIDLPLKEIGASWHSETGRDVGRAPDSDDGTWLADEPDDNLAEAVRRLSLLAVIDGVVHAPTPVPELRLVTRSDNYMDPPTMTLGWTSADLCDDQELSTGKRPTEFAVPASGTARIDCALFPIDREEDAHALGADWARRMKLRYERREVAPHVDAGMLGIDPKVDDATPIFAELAESFGNGGWAGLHLHDRAIVTDWLDLRDEVARVATAPTPEDVTGCLDATAALMDRMWGPAAAPAMPLVRLASRWRVAGARHGMGATHAGDDPGLARLPAF